MKFSHTKSVKWIYLPIVLCSTAVLSSTLSASEYIETNNANYEYIGGTTRFSVGVDNNLNGTAELGQVLIEDKDSSTIADVWVGFELDGNDKGVKAGGGRLNHHWVSRDASGRPEYVNKAFIAYDRNKEKQAKATVGYGQEYEMGFWEGYVGKGISNKRKVGTNSTATQDIFEKAYDYNVGGNVGTFLTGANMRVRGGADYAWGKGGSGEKDAKKVTVSAGVDKYFQDSPHSVSLDVSASRAEGGYNANKKTDTRANLTYNYEFGKNGIYGNGHTSKRIRIEIPGKPARPARTVRKAIKVPYKVARKVAVSQPVYVAQSCNYVKASAQLGCQYFFQKNSHRLIPAAQQRLREIIRQMRRSGNINNIRITGQACSSYGCGGNNAKVLAKRRADMVKNFLIRNGISARKITTHGIASNRNVVDITYSGQNVQRQRCGSRTTYKTVYDTRYKTQYKTVVVDRGAPATPGSVIWKTEVVKTQPTWVTRALHSSIKHNRNIGTYLTSDAQSGNSGNGNSGQNNQTTQIAANGNSATAQIGGQTIGIYVINDDRGDGIYISNVNIPQGTATISSDRQYIIYTPNNTGYVGQQIQGTYTIRDRHGNTASAPIVITLNK